MVPVTCSLNGHLQVITVFLGCFRIDLIFSELSVTSKFNGNEENGSVLFLSSKPIASCRQVAMFLRGC